MIPSITYKDTHSELFAAQDLKFNSLRASNLKLQEKKGRDYNIISGVQSLII